MASELRDRDVAAFVLAGGRSTRMGRDKALFPLAGRPLIAHALAIFNQCGLPASIAGAHSDLCAFAPVIDDAQAGRGPLAGVCAALASTSAAHAVFLPVDLPLLPASLLAYLLHHASVTASAVTVPSISGRAQTFPAVLDRAVLPALQSEFAAGRLGCFNAFEVAAATLRRPFCTVAAEYLVQSGHAAHPAGLAAAFWFLNLNTPADLGHAERCLRRIA